jgi:hypothetical protein
MDFDLEDLQRFEEELQRSEEEENKQQKLLEEAIASGDRALLRQRIKEAHDWMENGPCSNDRLLEHVNKIAKRVFGKPFSEMTPDDFKEPDKEPD